MARSFLTAINLNKNELQNAAVQNLAAAPASPVKGQLYFNSTGGDDTLYWWNGSQWIAAKAAAGATPAATVTTQAVGDAPVVGVSTNFAREDHKHGRESFGAVTAQTVFGAAAANGSAATLPRSDHTHGTPVHDAAAHSAIPISALAPAAANLNLGGFKITSLGSPAVATDAANKNYVDNVANGNSWKDAVRLATTGNITLSGISAIDGVTPTADVDHILVKNQTTASQNGIYYPSPGAWYRTEDADNGTEMLQASVFVTEGTVNADTAWVCTTNGPILLDTTPLTFAQFAGGGAVTAGAGLTQSGNILNVVAGDTSLIVGADELHVNTAIVAPTARNLIAGAGLTGGGDLTADRTFNVVAGDTTLTVAADDVRVNTAVIAPTARQVISGAGLTGGGDLSADRTLAVVAGDTSLTVAADDVRVNTAVIASVASLAGYVPTTRQVIAGAGLVNGGALSGDVTLNVGAGTGLTALADAIGVNGAVVPYWSSIMFAQALAGNVAFATGEVIPHTLGTRDVAVVVRNGAAPYQEVEVESEATTIDSVTVRYNPALGAGYRALVIAKAF